MADAAASNSHIRRSSAGGSWGNKMATGGKRGRHRKLTLPAGVSPVKVSYNIMQPLVCETHHEYGPILCCPFPDCPKGLPAADCWVTVNPPQVGDEVYQRTEWQLASGRTTWSWTDVDGLYLDIPRVFWREAYRTGLMPDVSPDRSAYHYTSLAGFLGMLRSGEIWLSDYAYLNDAAELTHGIACAREIFAEVAGLRPKSRKVLLPHAKPDYSQHRVCIASFSTEADSLSQWRAYGPIALGFELGGLAFGYSNSVRLQPVVYRPSAQDELLRMFAHLLATAWERERPSEKQRLRQLYSETDRLLDVIAFFKNEGFSDEHELRMVHTEIPRIWDAFDLDRAPERFRAASGLFVPYLTTKDIHREHPDRLPLREVVIGPSPKAEALRTGVERALRAHGYDIQVRVSGVTYRA
jgi:hypothetical protein